jgi:hypothetical protein
MELQPLEDWPFFRLFMFWRLTTFEVLPELVDNEWDLLVAGIACNSFCLPVLWGRLKVAERNFPFCVLLYSRFTGFEVVLEEAPLSLHNIGAGKAFGSIPFILPGRVLAIGHVDFEVAFRVLYA